MPRLQSPKSKIIVQPMADKRVQVGIIGASGYGAGELLRILANHPNVDVVALVSSSSEGALASELHPNLNGFYSTVRCTKELDISLFADQSISSVIFCALPHAHSGNYVLNLFRNPALAHVKIIDLSGDLRLHDASLAATWYPETEFNPDERKQIVYGLPELNRDAIKTARVIANPGCLASAAILALAPIASNDRRGRIIIDGKTGTSGAGRTPQAAFHHPSMHANCNAYKVLEHRHEPEIAAALGDPHKERLQITFVPHVIPTSRGIYVTCYFEDSKFSRDELYQIYRNFYRESVFIKITDEIPELRSVIGSNFCHIAIRKRDQQVVVTGCVDNLVKGMAGVGVQNFNLAHGLDETCGLFLPSLGIV